MKDRKPPALKPKDVATYDQYDVKPKALMDQNKRFAQEFVQRVLKKKS